MRRVRITLRDTARETADFFADLGAAVERDGDSVAATFADGGPSGLEDRVEAFLHLADRSALARVETASGDGPWCDGWRGAFFGSDVARFRIRPPWAPEPGAILVDPRGAFGSGAHPSTRLALELLDRTLRGREGQSLLDVGAGSGVLSVAAARCGLRVFASEREPSARKACLRTAAANGVALELLESFAGRAFDVVVANIPAPALVELARPLREAARGALIVSGMRAEQAPEVLAAMGSSAERFESPDGEWVAFLL